MGKFLQMGKFINGAGPQAPDPGAAWGGGGLGVGIISRIDFTLVS